MRSDEAAGPDVPELLHRHDAVPVPQRVVHHHPGVPEAPDPHLREAPHVGHPRDVPEGMAVRQLEPMDEREVVEMRVEVDDVQRLRVRAHDRIRDAVVAAQHDRKGAPREEPTHHVRHVVEGSRHVGRQHVGVARVDDAAVGELVGQKLPPERRVVVALTPPAEAHRVLPDPPRTEAGARHERGPLVARDAHHRDVRVEPVEVRRDHGAQERRNADERGVPARLSERLHRRPAQAPTRTGARSPGRSALAGPMPVAPEHGGDRPAVAPRSPARAAGWARRSRCRAWRRPP